MRILDKRVAVFFILSSLHNFAAASPDCVKPSAKNFVLASTYGIDEGRSGRWLLQSVDSADRIFLRRCSGRVGDSCYFAIDVKSGTYYFQQIVPDLTGGLSYPISTEKLWFTITGKGIDYIGHWVIDRIDLSAVKRLEIHYKLADLDRMVALCAIQGRELYFDRTKSPAAQIVD
jgi:hypothetical protein